MKPHQTPGFRRPSPASPLALCAFAALLAACAAPPRDQAPAPPPSAATVEVVQQPRLTERARVPETEPGFTSVSVSAHEIVISHDGSLPAFAEGDVLAGTQGGGYLARVTGVRTLDATHTALDTAPADLTELLAEGEFRVHYDAREHAARLGRYIAERRSEGGDENERVASEAEALQVSGNVKLLDLAGMSLPPSCGAAGGNSVEVDVTADFSPALDLDLKVGPKGGLNPFPEIKHFRLVLSGDLDLKTALHGEGTIDSECSVDLVQLAGAPFAIPLPSITFWVGPVPVFITTSVGPAVSADVKLATEAADVLVQAETKLGLDVGIDYDHKKKWTTIWQPSCESTGSSSVHASGEAQASCRVSAGGQVSARLYGVVGPDLGIAAYARSQTDSAPPYCAYDTRFDGGVRAFADAALGLSIGPLNLTLAKLDLVNLDLMRCDGPSASGSLREASECPDAE